MEAPRRKVTAKLSPQSPSGHGTSSSTSQSISPSPQAIVRAKVSSSARTTSPNTPSSSNASGTANLNINGTLRPQTGATARRSPSPVKMRPGSPAKLQSHLRPSTSRVPLVKGSTIIAHADRTRHGSISSVLSSTPVDPSSSTAPPPTTTLPRRDTNDMPNGDSAPSVNLDSGSGSFRIKSKVSGLAKPATPSLSTILSPPSPSSSSLTPAFPNANRPPRARATTIASRRPSINFSASQPVTPPLSHDPPQLVPLPTSPPASTISFSSHSSLSVSNAHSHSTSTGLTPPSLLTSHARSESSPISMLNIYAMGDPSLSHDEHSPNPPPRRTLIARVRPGTRISGGKGQGRMSGSSVAGEQDLGSNSSSRIELDDRNTDESERSDNETRKLSPQSTADDPEDDVRAEAKSNRKIADLEITTRSLLTINAALEASKLRQAREIRELRRKLRETRLAMPPERFRLLNKQESAEGGNDDAQEEESDEDEEESGSGNCDESFKRVKMLMEDLIHSGRSALAVPAPSCFLSVQQAISSPSSSSGKKLGLGIDTEPVTGTRMDQGEVLGWDVGSSLGTDSSSNVGKEASLQRWKHGVAIRSKVLSPEEAKLWVGEDGVKEGEEETQAEGEEETQAEGEEETQVEGEEETQVEGDKIEGESELDGVGSSASNQDATESYGGIIPDTGDALT